MKRWVVSALLSSAVLASCTDETPTLDSAGLFGTFDIVQAGEFLFATSTSRNELRVIDLAGDRREFVRAPNPLHPLSIPVVDRPVGLGRDVRYTADRIEGGQYVYARSAASPLVSVVSSARDGGLKEVARVSGEGVVTAVGGRSLESGNSMLYFATYRGEGSTLYEVELPPLAQIMGAALAPRAVATFPAQSVNALLVLPAANEVAVALRASAGRAGSTVLVTTTDGSSRPLKFPAPVRLLATNPASGTQIAAGRFVYGVLDEESCDGARSCVGVLAVERDTGEVVTPGGAGGLVIPIYPVQEGALIRGLEIASNATVGRANLLGSEARTVTYPLLGLITHADPLGRIAYFDALGMRHIDTRRSIRQVDPACDPATAEGGCARLHCEDTGEDCAPSRINAFDLLPVALPRLTSFDVTVVTPDVVREFQDDTSTGEKARTETTSVKTRTFSVIEALPENVQTAAGRTRDQVVTIHYQSTLTGLTSVVRAPGGGTTFKISANLTSRVRPGDAIELLNADSTVCGGALELTSVAVDGTLTAAAPVPAECEAASRFAVRAGATQPFLVVGSPSTDDTDLVSPVGYMGRVGFGEAFVFQGEAWHAPLLGDPTQPELSFTMGTGAGWYVREIVETTVRKDYKDESIVDEVETTVTETTPRSGQLMPNDRLQALSVSAFAPLQVRLSREGLGYVLPSTVLYYQPTGTVYLAYPEDPARRGTESVVASYNASTAVEGANTVFVRFD